MPTPRTREGTYLRVLRAPGLRRTWPALAVSSLGDGMSVVSITVLALELVSPKDRGLGLGLALTAFTIPGVVGAVVFGRFVRSAPGARLIGLDAVLRLTCLGAIAALALSDSLAYGTYVGLLACASLLHAWGNAGRYTLIAEWLPDELRRAGNAMLFSFDMATLIAGPVLAGLVIAVANVGTALAVDAGTFLVLAAVAWTNPLAAQGHETAAAPGGWRAGMRTLRRTPALLGLLTLTWFFNWLYGPVEVAIPLYSLTTLHGTNALIAWFFTAFGIGALLGSLTLGASRRLSVRAAVLVSVGGWGLALLPLAFLRSHAALAVVLFGVGGLLYAPFTAASQSIFQSQTPAHLLSQVLAARSALLLLAAPTGTAAGGPLVHWLGPPDALLLSAAATIVLAIVTGLVVAKHRPPPAGVVPVVTDSAPGVL